MTPTISIYMACSLGTFSTFSFLAPVPLVGIFFPSGDSFPSAWLSGEGDWAMATNDGMGDIHKSQQINTINSLSPWLLDSDNVYFYVNNSLAWICKNLKTIYGVPHFWQQCVAATSANDPCEHLCVVMVVIATVWMRTQGGCQCW